MKFPRTMKFQYEPYRDSLLRQVREEERSTGRRVTDVEIDLASFARLVDEQGRPYYAKTGEVYEIARYDHRPCVPVDDIEDTIEVRKLRVRCGS